MVMVCHSSSRQDFVFLSNRPLYTQLTSHFLYVSKTITYIHIYIYIYYNFIFKLSILNCRFFYFGTKVISSINLYTLLPFNTLIYQIRIYTVIYIINVAIIYHYVHNILDNKTLYIYNVFLSNML